MTLIVAVAVHPALVDSGLALWAVALIDFTITTTITLILIFLVAPALNEAFAEDTEVDKVDPEADPAAGGETSKIQVFALASGLLSTIYVAKNYSKK